MKVNDIVPPLIYGDMVKIKEPTDSKYKDLTGIIRKTNITVSTVTFEGIKKPVTIFNSDLEKIK